MKKELEKIGEFPKSVKQLQRKNDLNNEMLILVTNISNIKGKLKNLTKKNL